MQHANSKSSSPSGMRQPPTLTLGEPIAQLADYIHKASDAFFDIQRILMSKKKVPRTFLAQFKQGKLVFKTECESIRQSIQTSYRHAADYVTSSQQAPDDRAQSARRCFLSAKAVQQNIVEINSVYATIVADFKRQDQSLAQHLGNGKKVHHQCESAGTIVDPLKILTDSLEGVQLSLKKVKAFWDGHVAFLSLLMTRQTNYPSPGVEAKDVLELWTTYQRILLQASTSLLESTQAMAKDPSIPPQAKTAKQSRRPITLRRPSASDASSGSETDISSDISSDSPDASSLVTSSIPLGMRLQNFFKALLHRHSAIF